MTQHTSSEPIYTIDQVSAQCRLAPYILRYWEMHFPDLGSPEGRSKSHYSANDIALIMRIKKLLYSDRVTIEEAKKRLEQEKAFPVRDPVLVKTRQETTEQTRAISQDQAPEPAQVKVATQEMVTEVQPVVQVIAQQQAAVVSTDQKVLQLNETLQARMTALQSELDMERKNKNQLQNRIQQDEQKLNEMQALCAALQQNLNEAVQGRDSYQQKLSQNEQLSAQLQQQLTAAEQAKGLIQQQLDEQRELFEQMQRRLDELVSGQELLQQKLQDAEQGREQLEHQLIQMQSEAAGMMQSNSAIAAEREALVQEISNLRQQNVRLGQDNERLRELLTAALEVLKTVRGTI